MSARQRESHARLRDRSARPSPVVPVAEGGFFPVRRIFCVGRNYAEHAREMGHDPSREAPFFFTKPADALVIAGADTPYPPATSDLHHEIELVVAIGEEATAVSADAANGHIWGTPRASISRGATCQAEAKKLARPWDMAKGFDASAPIGDLAPASRIGHPENGRITLAVNGTTRQDGDIHDLIWSVPEAIAYLSTLVDADARRPDLHRHPGRCRGRRARRPARGRDRGHRHSRNDHRLMPTWSPQQDEALLAVSNWLKDKSGPQVFRLFGWAGTGKSTLARYLAEGVRSVKYAAFTGKAALVMRKKGCRGASTIHSLIYTLVSEKEGEPRFALDPESEALTADLIVIDEVSMVDEALAEGPPELRHQGAGAGRSVPAPAGAGRGLFHRA